MGKKASCRSVDNRHVRIAVVFPCVVIGLPWPMLSMVSQNPIAV
jgi:hypothetical protein